MNIGTLFTKTARTFPERLAIAYGDKEWTYYQANERINRLANAFGSLGLSRGERVAIAGVLAAVVAVAISYPCSRLKGHYFAIATIACCCCGTAKRSIR